MRLLILIIICGIVFPALSQDETPEKAAFDLPDVVIKAEDRSKSDLLQKKDPGSIEVQYQKEIPTSQKINPDILEADKALPELSTEKKDRTELSQFYFAMGNIIPVSYRFVHGRTLQSSSYLWELSREYRGEYIPNAKSSLDGLSIDYTFKLSPQEKLSISSRFEKKTTTLPTAQSVSSGNYELTFLPSLLTYERILGQSGSINAAFRIDNLDIQAGDRLRNCFGLEANAAYKNTISSELSYEVSSKLNNAVSKAGINLQYKPEGNSPLQGSIGTDYYRTFLPKVQNESFLAPSFGLRYELSDNTLFHLAYNPGILDLYAGATYTAREYTEINYSLMPQTRVSSWQGIISQQLYKQLNWQARLSVSRTKQTIGYADSNNNGFIEPVNLGWGNLFEAELNLNYYINSLYSLLIDYHYQNNRLDSGQQVPGKPGQVLGIKLNYKDAEESLDAVIELKYTADQVDMINTAQKLPDYFLVNLEASKAINRNLKVNAGIKNIFNTVYFQRGDFREPGLSIQLGAETAF
ncbi:MAG: TonB-dependent receptor [Candidatus Margulisiibacteriota bacterium]